MEDPMVQRRELRINIALKGNSGGGVRPVICDLERV